MKKYTIQKLLKRLFLVESWKKRLILVTYDGCVITLSVLLALTSRLESRDFLYLIDTYAACFFAVFCSLTIFFARGFYKSFTRHITIRSAINIFEATVTSALLLFALIIFGELQIPRSVPFIQAAFSILSIASLRFFIRALGQDINRANRKNIAVYGAGSAGRQLIEALKWDEKYRISQIIDDDPKLCGQSLGGIKIEGLDASRKKFVVNEIDTILLATPNAKQKVRERIFDVLAEVPVKVKSIPDLASLISGKANISEFREIDIIDLLGREPAKPDPLLLAKTITGKTVFVTGAGGSIGSELCRQIATLAPERLLILDLSEFAIYSLIQELEKIYPSLSIVPIIGSVQDQSFVNKVIGAFTIDTIYHAAAYKHVPLMEQNVMQCISNNVFGTLNVATAAADARVSHFILVSTDKAVNPTNFMGASKRLAELVCKDLAQTKSTTKFGIVRFGNVLGSSGSVVPYFKQQIAAGGPVTVTHIDVVRYFMSIPEAAQLVIQAGAMAGHGEIFVLDMGKPIKVLDLAKKMITLSGKKPILEHERPSGKNDILIRIIGLRPGEKMFEELSYSGNLTGTSHERIMKTDDVGILSENLAKVLKNALHAIETDDHEAVVKIVRELCESVPNQRASSDVFLNNPKNNKIHTIIQLGSSSKS